MRYSLSGALALILIAGFAVAHSGVTNPAVKARMDLMVDVKDATAVLGNMAKQAIPYDTAKAEAARLNLIEAAEGIPAAFEAPENDPHSEARPAIWRDWNGFETSAKTMQAAAQQIDTSNLTSLRAGLGQLAKSCASCHESYRIEK